MVSQFYYWSFASGNVAKILRRFTTFSSFPKSIMLRFIKYLPFRVWTKFSDKSWEILDFRNLEIIFGIFLQLEIVDKPNQYLKLP